MIGTKMSLVNIPAGTNPPNNNMIKYLDLKLNADTYKHFLANNVTLTNQQKEQMLDKLHTEYTATASSPKAIATLSVTATGAYSSYTKDIPLYYNATTFPVTSVTLADTVFGF